MSNNKISFLGNEKILNIGPALLRMSKILKN